MKKTSSGPNLDANLEMTQIWQCCRLTIVQALHIPTPKKNSGVYRPKSREKNVLLSCLAQRLCLQVDVRNRYGNARGVGAAETALERSYSTDNSRSENLTLLLQTFFFGVIKARIKTVMSLSTSN